MYGWVPLLFSWNYHNVVNNPIQNKKLTKKIKQTSSSSIWCSIFCIISLLRINESEYLGYATKVKMYSLVWLILICSKTNKTDLKKKKTKAAPRSLGSELPSIYYKQGGAAGRGPLSQPRGQDPFSSEENRLKIRTTRGFPRPHLSQLKGALGCAMETAITTGTPAAFEHTQGLGGPWQDVSTRRKERSPESTGQPQPLRNLVGPQKCACYFTSSHTPGPPLAEGGWAVFHVPGCAEGLRVFV